MASITFPEKPKIMGVVNATPDSFSDGYPDPDAAVAHGLALMADGADIIDVGGEATSPRATPVDAAEEQRRVLPVIERRVAAGDTVSIDTTKAAVARAAVDGGARIVNDVSGGLFDPEMAQFVRTANVTYICGHLRGRSIAEVFTAEAPVSWREVADELAARIADLPAQRTWVDPGIGFGKGGFVDGNLELIRHAGDIGRALGRPVVVGPSRKRFLVKLLGGHADPLSLDVASVAACLGAVGAGAHVLRVHNVALLRAALAVYTKL